MADVWDPQQYQRFQSERAQPFHDLLLLLAPTPQPPRVVDLGCGPGELTALLHDHTRAAECLGLDSSSAMLESALPHTRPGLRFEQCDIDSDWGDGWDIIFSNAALHWLPDHPALFSRLASRLRDGGQLAVQMPANFDHPSHRIASELAAEPPFVDALEGYSRRVPVLAPDEYSILLNELGFSEQHVRLQVYGHQLADSAAVVEWTRGTLLTDYQRRLSPAVFDEFLNAYRTRVVAALGPARPYFYPFKRLLLWGRRGT